MCREPTMAVIDDDSAVADIAPFFLARKSTDSTRGPPARIEQRNYRYTRASKTLGCAQDAPNLHPARWAEGLGRSVSQSPACFILPSGRAVLIFSVLGFRIGNLLRVTSAAVLCITTRRRPVKPAQADGAAEDHRRRCTWNAIRHRRY